MDDSPRSDPQPPTMNDENTAATPRCVGSTGDFYRCSVKETLRREARKLNHNGEQGQALNDGHKAHEESNFFKSAQWYGLSMFKGSTYVWNPR